MLRRLAFIALAGACWSTAAAQDGREPYPDPRLRPAEKIEGQLPAEGKPQAAKPAARPDIYSETADARGAVAAALDKARAENRRVLIQWGANWCGWCHLLHEACAKDVGLRAKLRDEYDVVLIDVGRFNTNMELAEKFGAKLKESGIPYLTVLSAEGKVLANQETGSLEVKGQPKHDPKAVLEFLTKHQAPPLSAESVLAEAMSRAKVDDQLVLVRWGAPWCGWCHKMDAWLAREDVKLLIGKDYLNVKIDQDRMTGGKELLAKHGGAGKGIPWFVVLDPATGKTLATSDGPKGNVGFPAAPEEIEHFTDILTKTAKRLSPADIKTLARSLEPVKDARPDAPAGDGGHR
ncbi:MAG: thioredoxin family protein [Phycisphaerales bacterium]